MTFKNLISENGTQISLGRVMLWSIFCMCIYYWMYLEQDTPMTLIDGLYAMILYNFGKKGVSAFDRLSQLKHGGKNAE